MSITNNKSFCARLWTHLMFECNGDVSMCCLMMNRRGSTLGNTKTSNLKELWNSPAMMQTRKDMLEGKPIAACAKCYNKENGGERSARIISNEMYKDHIDEYVRNTTPDGRYEDFNLIYWDVRFSNKCNFKCRMCGPGSSSAWVSDAKKLSSNQREIAKLAQLENIDGQDSLTYLKENANKVEQILFAGGEPLIMDEHYQLMEHLIANNNFCELNYHTNLSKLQYKEWNAVEMWKKWPKDKLTVWPSIDETGERAELIRSGTVWDEIEANLETLLKEGINIQPNITVSVLNVNRLPELFLFFYHKGIITSKANFTLGMVYTPARLNINILPDDYKQETKEKLLNFIDSFKMLAGTDLTGKFGFILKALDQPHSPENAKLFLDHTYKLDAIRSEDTFKVIPELECIRTTYQTPHSQ